MEPALMPMITPSNLLSRARRCNSLKNLCSVGTCPPHRMMKLASQIIRAAYLCVLRSNTSYLSKARSARPKISRMSHAIRSVISLSSGAEDIIRQWRGWGSVFRNLLRNPFAGFKSPAQPIQGLLVRNKVILFW